MSNIYLGDFITYGKNVYVDTKRRNIKYSKKVLKDLTIEVIDMIKKFIDEIYTEKVEENKFKGVSEYPYIFAPFFSSKVYERMKSLLLSSDISFVEAFNKSVNWFMKNEDLNIFSYQTINKCKDDMDFQTIHIKERVIKMLNRYLIHKYVKNVENNVIISISKFEKEYFYQLPKNVKGFVCKSIDNELLIKDMVYAYNIPVVVTSRKFNDTKHIIIDNKNNKLYLDPNQTFLEKCIEDINNLEINVGDKPRYQSSEIIYYASLVDLRNIDIVMDKDWYPGGVFYRTEYIYLSKGNFPSYEELLDNFITLMEAFHDRDIHIQLPDFNHYKQVDYEIDEVYTEVELVSLFHRIYFRTVNAIYEASQKTGKQVTLVIPMLRVGTEIYDWRDKLDCFLGIDRSINIGPKFGIVMETESAFEYFEDYRRVSSIIFGMDNFIEESLEISRYDKVDNEYFMRAAWPDLQLAHQFYRKNGVRKLHIISGFILRDPFYLRKFINKGFKHFIISLGHLKSAEEVLYQYESTRGKYIGVHAGRKTTNLNK